MFLLRGKFSPLTFRDVIDRKGYVAILPCGVVDSRIDYSFYASGLSVVRSEPVWLTQMSPALV